VQVKLALSQLRAVQCNVLVVTQAQPNMLQLFLAANPQPFPVVCDPGKTAYQAFGLLRTSWLTFLKPSVVWGYLKLMLKGYGVRKPSGREDLLQLGGDFLLNQGGTICWQQTSKDPSERPRLVEVLSVLNNQSCSD
jgi:hypothetical protein